MIAAPAARQEGTPYRLVGTGGAVVAERPGRGVRSWSVVLARAGDRWLVYDVVRG